MPIGRPSLEDTKWSNTRAILQSIRRQEIVHTIEKESQPHLKSYYVFLIFFRSNPSKLYFAYIQSSFSSKFPLLGSKSTKTRRLTNETKFKKLKSA